MKRLTQYSYRRFRQFTLDRMRTNGTKKLRVDLELQARRLRDVADVGSVNSSICRVKRDPGRLMDSHSAGPASTVVEELRATADSFGSTWSVPSAANRA